MSKPPEMTPVSIGMSWSRWWRIGLISATVVVGVLLWIGTTASDANTFVNLVIPTYLTGFGTLALAVATVIVTREDRVRAEALRKIDWNEHVAERNLANTRERRSQAEAVVCWPYLITPQTNDEINRGDPVPDAPGNSAHIRNGSQLPVWNVEVTFFETTGEQAGQPDLRSVFPPGNDDVQMPAELAQEKSFDVTMSFRDAASVRWVRDKVGNLTEDPNQKDRVALGPEQPGRGDADTIYAKELARQAARNKSE